MIIEINLNNFNLDKSLDFKMLERGFHQHLSSLCKFSGSSKSHETFKIDIEIEIETKEKVKFIWDFSELKKRLIKIELINEENEEKQLIKVNEIIKHVINLVKNPSAHLKSCYLFGYTGNILDGSYKLPKFYLTPGHINTNDSLYSKNHEKIIYLYLKTKSINLMEAKETSRVQAQEYSSLLSLFLGIGLYDKAGYWQKDSSLEYQLLSQKEEYKWIKNINGEYKLLQLDYFPPQKIPDFSKGSFRNVNRAEIDWLHGNNDEETLKCPHDISSLFNMVDNLPLKTKERFYRATHLFQFAEIQKEHYPSVSLAYAFASVDALTRNKDRVGKRVDDLVKSLLPELDLDYWKFFPKIRHAHFHGGYFKYGEFKPCFFYGHDYQQNVESIKMMQCYQICRNVIIRWLLEKGIKK